MNTTSKLRRTQGYLATVQRDLAEARRALSERTKALDAAKTTLERERAGLPKEPPAGQPISQAFAQSLMEQKRPFFEAEEAVGTLAREVRELEGAARKLSDIAEAPQRMKASLDLFRLLASRRRELRAEADRNAKLQRSLEGRIATAKATTEAVRRKAVSAMVESDGAALPVSDSLVRASVEIQITEDALADAAAKGTSLADELRTLPAQLRDARYEYRYYHWLVAEAELQEALLPLIPVLARAQVARCTVDPGTNVAMAEIAIPKDAITKAEESLALELSDEGE